MSSSPSSLFTFAAISVAVAALTACGGGSSTSPTSSAAAPTTTAAVTPVNVTVVDGLIRNAKVCVDSNNNNTCDAGEIQGTTDANGQVTLSVPTASLGTAKIIANVGTDAVDVDNGAVPTAFTMTAPATGSTTAVVSPLTTMVQSKMDTDKVSLQDAVNYVKAQTGLTTASPLDNFVAQRTTSAEHRKAGDIARLLVLSMQKSKTVAATATGTCLTGRTESENNEIKDTNINRSLSQRLGEVTQASNSVNRENENENDDGARRTVATVVPVCGTATTTTTTTTTTGTTTGTTTSTASATNGKALYTASCSSCHGTNTAIGRNANSILSAIAANKGGMGSLKATIGTQQAADIAAYAANPSAVTTTTTTATTTTPATTTTTPATTTETGTTTPATATTTTTPTTTASTSATNGKAIYAASCAICHTANAAANVSKVLKGANSAITIQNAITNNIGGMGFLSTTITATQAADLAAFLATPGI